MSTQRRENGSAPATKTFRRGPRSRCRRRTCRERALTPGLAPAVFPVRRDLANAIAETATRRDERRLATDSLQSDRYTRQHVRLGFKQIGRGSPPDGDDRGRKAATTAFFEVILSAHPLTFRLARFHQTLPQLPTALSCRRERHDGKRNLHFQHAA